MIRSRDTGIEELTGLRSEDAAEIARLKADIVAQQGCLLRWRAEALAARRLLTCTNLDWEDTDYAAARKANGEE